MSEKVRLSKLMSQRGICSRRDADREIENGNVFVNGLQVKKLGVRVCLDAIIDLKTNIKPFTVLLNKPLGIVSTQPEKNYKAAVELITSDSCFDRHFVRFSKHKALSCAGRLDINSTGLLVLTQDGVIARQLVSENSQLEKEYLVSVEGKVTEEKIAKLRSGLRIDGRLLKDAKVDVVRPGLLRFILFEGKKRQIRKMCQMVDLKVMKLTRTRIGKILLGNLPLGKWRRLKPHEKFW